MTTLASAEFLKIGYIAEVTHGTTPTSPALQELRKTGLSVNPNNKTIRSGEIVTGGRTRDIIPVGQEPALTLPLELSADTYDDQLAHVCRGSWVTLPEKVGPTALASVATSGVFTIDSGGATFIVGHYVKSSGWATAANNAFGPVTANTGTTVTATISTAAETAPSTARLKVVGLQAVANAGLSASTTTNNHLVLATVNPTTAGIVPGLWVRPRGFAITPANNDWCRVSSVTGSGPWNIVLDVVPSGFAADAGTGVKVILEFGDYVRDTGVLTTGTYEAQASDVAQYAYVRGAGVSGMTLDVPPNAIATGSFELTALTASAWSGSRVSGATDVAVTTSDVMNTASNVGRIGEGGTAIGAALVTRTGLKFTNELRRLPAVQSTGTANLQLGAFTVDISLETYLDATTAPALNAKYIAGTASSFDLRTTDGSGNGYLFDFPKTKYSEGGNTSAQKNSAMTIPLTCTALEYTPASGAAYSAHLQKIEAAA